MASMSTTSWRLRPTQRPRRERRSDAQSAAPRRVLGRILQRVPVQLYPDTFLSEPEVSPSQVAALVGYDQRANDLFELHVAIMGYYDARARLLRQSVDSAQFWHADLSGRRRLADRVLSRKQPAHAGQRA